MLYGNVDIRDAQLSFFNQEQIAKVLVEEGDAVEAGDLLARLETDRLDAQIDQARAQLAARDAVLLRLNNGTRPQEIVAAEAAIAQTEARLANARATEKRLKETAVRGASSVQELENAEAGVRVESAQLRVQQAQLDLLVEGPRQEDIAEAAAGRDAAGAALHLLEAQRSDSELHAPAAGIIESRLLEAGEIASPERPVFTLALLDPKWVRTYVPEPRLSDVVEGMTATVLTDGAPEARYAGWIGFISPRAEFTPKNVETPELRTQLVYEVRVYVKDPENKLRLGQPVTVRVDDAPQAVAP